ncbi:glycosyltransferase family 4 protein [Haloarcula brevis]|uniref:glycosyltransferase family 4 protein n=1 Tax=Haloarcula brevis TaxID=3111453 RepID=UPI00300F72DB
MKICILSKMFPPGIGGAETYAYELADGLGQRGHEVDVYTQWVDDPNEEIDIHENVTVHRITKARKKLVTFETLYFSFKARRTIDFSQYDIVHGTLTPASTILVTPFNDIEPPVVLTGHGTSIGETKSVALETPADYLLKFFFYPMNVVMDYLAGRYADGIISISDHAQEELIRRYGFSEKKVQMIPHGVNTDKFQPQEETHPAVSPEKTTLLYVGRIGPRKGIDLALKSLSEIKDAEIEFLIAGTGRHKDHLEETAESLDVAEQTRFLGYVSEDELPELYSSADVFVLPSLYEGFGLVLLEAMASGTPVIGTDVGGIPTAVDDGTTGLLVNRNVPSLTTAINRIVQNEDYRKELSQNAIEKAEDTSWDSIVNSVEQMYNSVGTAKRQYNE